MRRGVVLAVAAVVGAALATAAVLVLQADRGESSGPLRLVGDDPRIHVFHGDSVFPAQLGVGMSVAYDSESKCLYLMDPQQVRRLVVWPRGSRPTIENGKRGVRVSGVGLILEGDRIVEASVAGGPIFEPDGDETAIAAALRDLDTCLPDSGEFTLFYEIEEISRATN